MKSFTSLPALLALPLLCAATPLDPRTASSCQDVTFTLTASATNRLALNPPANFQDINLVIPFLLQPNVPYQVSGTYKLYGQYCAPTSKIPGREKTLQILVHGNTYSHTYFNGLEALPSSGQPSWTGFFNRLGYATLAIDRLGFGRSDHPDPLLVVQAPYQAALYTELIKLLKSSATLPGSIPNQWSKVVWVGHSYGSVIGTQISANFPAADVAAYIQTGIAVPKEGQNALPGQLGGLYVPASTYDPVRFPPTTYAPGYVVSSSKVGRENSFYSIPGGDFSTAKFDQDFKTQEPAALGEILTSNVYTSASYNRPVFVLAGRADAVFCGNGSRALGTPDCGEGPNSQLAAIKTLYPAGKISSCFGLDPVKLTSPTVKYQRRNLTRIPSQIVGIAITSITRRHWVLQKWKSSCRSKGFNCRIQMDLQLVLASPLLTPYMT